MLIITADTDINEAEAEAEDDSMPTAVVVEYCCKLK